VCVKRGGLCSCTPCRNRTPPKTMRLTFRPHPACIAHPLPAEQMAADGDAGGALLLAREHMTPLVDSAPELLPVLKSSMALLVRPEAAGQTPSAGQSQPDGQTPVHEEVAALLALLAARLQEGGPQELRAPRLQQLLRGLSRGYLLWLQIQRCRDPFAAALGIPEVLTLQAGPTAAAAGGSGAAGRGQAGVVSLDALLFGPSGVRPGGGLVRPPGRRLPHRAAGRWGARQVVDAAGSSEEDESMSDEEEEGGRGGGGGGAGRLAAVLAGARARAMQAWPAPDRGLSAAAAAAAAAYGAAGPGQAAAGAQQQQQQQEAGEEEEDVEEVQVLLGGGGGGVDAFEAQQWLEAHADEGPLDEAAILQVRVGGWVGWGGVGWGGKGFYGWVGGCGGAGGEASCDGVGMSRMMQRGLGAGLGCRVGGQGQEAVRVWQGRGEGRLVQAMYKGRVGGLLGRLECTVCRGGCATSGRACRM
jgi:hypothetical protein